MGAHRNPEAAIVRYGNYEALAAHNRPPTVARLRELRPVIERLANAAHLTDVRVFRSVARGEAASASDLDLIVSPRPGATLSNIAQFVIDLELILGCAVSVTSTAGPDPTSDRQIRADAGAL